MAFKEEIIITAQDQASPEIDRAAAAMENVNNLLSVEKLKEYSDAVFNFGKGLITDFVGGALSSEKALNFLESTLKRTATTAQEYISFAEGMTTQERNSNEVVQSKIALYTDLATQLQANSVLEDDAIIRAAAMFESNEKLRMNTSEYLNLLPNIAAAMEQFTGQQVTADMAARELIRGVEGGSRIFNQLGIDLNGANGEFIGTEAAIKLLNSATAGLGDSVLNADGGIRQLQNAWGDFKDAIGAEILPVARTLISDFLLPAVQWLAALDPEIKAFIAQAVIMSTVIAGGVSVIAGFSLAIAAIGTAAATTAAYFAGITAAAWALYEALDYLFELMNVNAALQGFFEMFMNYEGASLAEDVQTAARRGNSGNRIYNGIADAQDEQEYNILPENIGLENLYG